MDNDKVIFESDDIQKYKFVERDSVNENKKVNYNMILDMLLLHLNQH